LLARASKGRGERIFRLRNLIYVAFPLSSPPSLAADGCRLRDKGWRSKIEYKRRRVSPGPHALPSYLLREGLYSDAASQAGLQRVDGVDKKSIKVAALLPAGEHVGERRFDERASTCLLQLHKLGLPYPFTTPRLACSLANMGDFDLLTHTQRQRQRVGLRRGGRRAGGAGGRGGSARRARGRRRRGRRRRSAATANVIASVMHAGADESRN